MHTPIVNVTCQVLQHIASGHSVSVVKEPSVKHYLRPEIPTNYDNKGELISRRGDISYGDIILNDTKIIDVTTRTVSNPESINRVGKTVRRGEKDKYRFYEKHCLFPAGIALVPFSIDSYGRWGEVFKSFLKSECYLATGGNDVKKYNWLITRSRDRIQVAHTNALGKSLMHLYESCVQEYDKYLLTLRPHPLPKHAIPHAK
jgi:hypothetical protein